MRILLLGKNGQVGWELQRSLVPLGEIVAFDTPECDFTDPAGLRRIVQETQPQIIVNAAAYTAVDKAESDSARAQAVNAEAVGLLAAEAARVGGWFVHYSTDYIFDGAKAGAYAEDDVANPLCVYGRSKWQGEEAVRAASARHLILRTSWVYGAHGANFMKTVLRLAAEREELRIVADQIGAPTSAELLADVTAFALHDVLRKSAQAAGGTYHLTARGETSWHGFARFIVEEAGRMGRALRCKPERVLPIATADYPLPAKRPPNSRLAVDKIESEFALQLPEWTWHARRTLQEVLQG